MRVLGGETEVYTDVHFAVTEYGEPLVDDRGNKMRRPRKFKWSVRDGDREILALIGTGVDMAIPENSTLANQTTASDAARRNFAETFGRVAERTISKNLDVQPTLEIRPGYQFNVLVDQDMVFPSDYRDKH